jgi:hypothetical protein
MDLVYTFTLALFLITLTVGPHCQPFKSWFIGLACNELVLLLD